MSKILSKDDILGCDDALVTPLPVPEWGGQVFMRVLSVSQAEKLAEKGTTIENVELLVLGLCNEKGDSVFTADDIDALNRKNSRVVAKIADAIVKHNSMDAQAVEDKKGN